MNLTTKYRRKAKGLGIPFGVLHETYRELRRLERDGRETEWAIRRESWEAHVSKGCRPFWRHGWQARYPHAFGEGDYTTIPHFDQLAEDLSSRYPCLALDDTPEESLFELLRRPHNKLPAAEETWEEALDQCLEMVEEWAEQEATSFPFGANVEDDDEIF